MHPKTKKPIYINLINMLKIRAATNGYFINTEFNQKEKTFEISNKNVRTDETIYKKTFGYKNPQEKDSLIARAYEEYFIDMFDYGIVLNDESFKATR